MDSRADRRCEKYQIHKQSGYDGSRDAAGGDRQRAHRGLFRLGQLAPDDTSDEPLGVWGRSSCLGVGGLSGKVPLSPQAREAELAVREAEAARAADEDK